MPGFGTLGHFGHRGIAWASATRTASAPPTLSRREAQLHALDEGAEGPDATELLSESEHNAHIASGKVISILVKRERGTCLVETDSVYGAALVMPQIARSSGWTRSLTISALRSYLFLVVNLFVQASLLYLISIEEMVMDKFSGQMYLCDFGATLPTCPSGAGCQGPGGTQYTASRLYGWDQWVTRNFVKSSLKQLFPERADDIDELVDPGEYGLESYYCRLLCCFLFMMAVMNDLIGTIEVCYLLYFVPSRSEPWITYEVPSWATKDYAKAVHNWSELDLVKVKVAGMPRLWKFFNVLFVIGPKAILWKCTAQAGTTFLMETSGIEDLIVNSIALTFILNIDELICANFTTAATRYLLDRLEGFRLFDVSEEERQTEEQLVEKVAEERRWALWSCSDTFALVPVRLMMTMLLTMLAVGEYYNRHCVKSDDGTFVSHTMYLPRQILYTQANFWLPNFFPVDSLPSPFWRMPPSPPSPPSPTPPP